MKRILVTGGLGYIGSHTCVELKNANYDVIVMDNCTNSSSDVVHKIEEIVGSDVSFHKEDVTNGRFTSLKIDGIIHFAAHKSVGESVKDPLKYYDNNLGGLQSILNFAARDKIPFVFSSSACVYGDKYDGLLDETLPSMAINPYGTTKVVGERMVEECDMAYGIPSVSLRYFNPIGSHESGLLGDTTITNLMPYLLKVAAKELDVLTIFGKDYDTPDGTAIRDYIHVVDLAKAHVSALELISNGVSQSPINIGNGRGYSVLEVIEAFQNSTGIEIPVQFGPRRSGDAQRLVASIERSNRLLKRPQGKSLEEMCSSAWNFKQQRMKENI